MTGRKTIGISEDRRQPVARKKKFDPESFRM